jgi:hypothetical protein
MTEAGGYPYPQTEQEDGAPVRPYVHNRLTDTWSLVSAGAFFLGREAAMAAFAKSWRQP